MDNYASPSRHAIFPSTKGVGSAKLLLGCMGSGKTTELFRLMEVLEVALQPDAILKIKSMIDKRKGGTDKNGITYMRTHNERTVPAHAVETLMEVTESEEYRVAQFVFVDEGQFFPDLVEFIWKCMLDGKQLFIAALNGDSDQKPFPSVSEAMPLCTESSILKGICAHCRVSWSSFTIVKKEVSKSDGQIDVGGFEKYDGVCGACLVVHRKQEATALAVRSRIQELAGEYRELLEEEVEESRYPELLRSSSDDPGSPPRDVYDVGMHGFGKDESTGPLY